jgi:hypothetical protein
MRELKDDGPELTAEQDAEALRIRERLEPAVLRELTNMARLMASKSNRELFGRTEFEIRDMAHRIGAMVLETAAEERQKKGRVRGC